MDREKREESRERTEDRPGEKGRYHNDYSPRYRPAYDIYEKARIHMRELKKKGKRAEKE